MGFRRGASGRLRRTPRCRPSPGCRGEGPAPELRWPRRQRAAGRRRSLRSEPARGRAPPFGGRREHPRPPAHGRAIPHLEPGIRRWHSRPHGPPPPRSSGRRCAERPPRSRRRPADGVGSIRPRTRRCSRPRWRPPPRRAPTGVEAEHTSLATYATAPSPDLGLRSCTRRSGQSRLRPGQGAASPQEAA